MKKILLISTIVALAAVSCTKGELDGQGAVPGQIQVSATIAGAQSRGPLEGGAVLTDMRFLHGQLAAPVHTGAAVDLSGQTPFGGSRAADGAITFVSGKEPMYDKLTGKHSYLLGYHPAGTAGANIVTWTPDGATDILISDAWYAGTYISPLDRGLTLSHALGCIEVQCEVSSASTLEQVRQSWGKIRGVLFKGTPKQLTLSYATNKVTPSSDRVDFPLLNGNTYIAGAFAPIDVPQANVVLASAMIAPTDANTFTLSVLSENRVSVDVLVTLATDVKFAAGQRHTVTLSFDAASGKIVASATTVNDWLPGENSVPPTLEPNAPGPVIEYGKGEFPLTGDVKYGETYKSYNTLYGESAAATGGTNGDWNTSKVSAYIGELPYAKFEVAKIDLNTDNKLDWRQLQGTTKGGNICAKFFGSAWRLPRLSELRLIYENRVKLNETEGFVTLSNSRAAATELDDTYTFVCDLNNNGLVYLSMKSDRSIVRCIKEIPVVEPPGPILESGKGKYPQTGIVGTAISYAGYNDLHGESKAATGGTNGLWYDTKELAFAGEPQYYKFEIAKRDAYVGVVKNRTWQVLQGTLDDYSDNICVKTHGNGWRLPRVSELRLMYENRVELNKAEGFTDFTTVPTNEYYWSATETAYDRAHIVLFDLGGMGGQGKAQTSGNVRCIKEVPPPKIGDYYYSDKSFSSTFDAGKTLLGIIYRVNPNGTGMLVDVKEYTGAWSTVQETTRASGEDSGVANTTTIKGLPGWSTKYPVFKYCEDKNTGGVTLWYLPASKELRALYAGYSGLRWMATGANTINDEINDWSNAVSMPGNATYVAARTAFNAKMTAAGVGGTAFAASDCWSATEGGASGAWFVNFSSGLTYNNNKTYTGYKARCVRAF